MRISLYEISGGADINAHHPAPLDEEVNNIVYTYIYIYI